MQVYNMDTLQVVSSHLKTDDILAWSTFGLAIFTLLMVIAGIIQIRSLAHSEKLGTLSQYLNRYNMIVGRIPLRCFQENFSISKLNSKAKTNLLQIMFDYWNLIAEEFMFQRRGWIDDEIWNGWRRGLEYHLEHHKIFRESYEILINSFRYNRMLREFMENNCPSEQNVV